MRFSAPRNPLKQRFQLRSARGIEVLDLANSTQQVLAEMRVVFAILRARTELDAIVKQRFEPIEFRAGHVRLDV